MVMKLEVPHHSFDLLTLHSYGAEDGIEFMETYEVSSQKWYTTVFI